MLERAVMLPLPLLLPPLPQDQLSARSSDKDSDRFTVAPKPTCIFEKGRMKRGEKREANNLLLFLLLLDAIIIDLDKSE